MLDPQFSNTSFCLLEKNEIIAHANLWPRFIHSTKSLTKTTTPERIGLVGNVATDSRQRGKGIMKSLFAALENYAINNGISALILWSDLFQFYQKLGFTSLNSELRVCFHRAKTKPSRGGQFVPISPSSLEDYETLNHLRMQLGTDTLTRTADEFRQLASIPETHFFMQSRRNQITGYGIIGRGYDMVGVIHEWAVGSPEDLLQLINSVFAQSELEELYLLCPPSLEGSFISPIGNSVFHQEHACMALCKPVNNNSVSLDDLFIWGMDSI